MAISAGQKFFVRMHTAIFRASKGRIGGRIQGLDSVALTTTGRTSGLPRTTMLTALHDGDNLVVVASANASPTDPAWYRNLVADPNVTVELGGERITMTAHTATGAERERLWALVTAATSAYATYQARTERQIPIVLLTR